ncbi:MAG: UDP-N-acetylmuramoyl-L-alanyl-D-glutamate--2,6-diaminopimelate ligase [Bacteroidia bacterium]|nr:UDP-N-acetylmuramoyl-L-alanyl-D-glutamate--2,6-diaminopimelate ligase [Bacteroidia bacterium]
MLLSSVIHGLQARLLNSSLDPDILGIESDSRNVRPGFLFVAVKGTQADGHAYIARAIELGAAAVMAETLPEPLPEGVAWIRSSSTRQDLGLALANFYEHPARDLQVCGVTGTNGKTTVATLLYQLFTALGYRCGLISTVSYRIGSEVLPSTHTTPDAVQLHRLLHRMRESGCTHVFMEVSSHSLDQERVSGVPFRLGMFTNLTHDHLDYHGSFQAYLRAKKRLFDGLAPGSAAIVNTDDRNGLVMVQNTQARVRTYALKHAADYRARIIENTLEGLHLDVDGREVWFRLVGSFNAYNLLLVYAAAAELGAAPEEVLQAMSLLEGAEGRFQLIRSAGGMTGIVDYAHTPDALENVLYTIRNVNQGQAHILTVVGCGGNRDREKRPKMAKIAAELSDQVILTSDNPREEDPQEILNDMWAGVPAEHQRKTLIIENRREAIRTACRLAQAQDIILVAGKGHETYQEIRGVRHPFDDREQLREAMQPQL